MNKSLQVLIFCMFSWSLSGQFTSAPVLTIQDSLKIQLDLDKGISYSHTIKAKQTLFSIAKFFNITVDEILYENDLNNESVISIGQILKIPLRDANISKVPLRPANAVPVLYQVQPKETLFRISRVYFPQAMEDMVSRNQLADLSLSLGEELIIGYYPLDNSALFELSDDHSLETRTDTVFQFQDMSDIQEDSQVGTYVRSKRGIAIWNKNGSDRTNAFVLHRDAQVNSIIELYNPVVGRKTMAKVVGTIPKDYYQKDVIMIMSPKVAESLGALDSRLMVEMSYQE